MNFLNKFGKIFVGAGESLIRPYKSIFRGGAGPSPAPYKSIF